MPAYRGRFARAATLAAALSFVLAARASAQNVTIAAGAAPLYGGTVSGAGTYSAGDPVNLLASPAAGFTFVDWTEFGTEVGTNPSLSFTATVDRTLVANFVTSTTSEMFDLDTGSPALFNGEGIPIVQTVGGLTATFSSPQGSVFSIQSDGSTGWSLSQFSGHYLYDNNLDRNTLVIAFDRDLAALYLVFATADFHQSEVPTTLELTGYENGVRVGSASAHGTYGFDTMPMGTLSFNPSGLFNSVELVLPYQPLGCTDFFVDNVLAALPYTLGVPEGTLPSSTRLEARPNPGAGPVDIVFDLPRAGEVRLAIYDLRGGLVREIAAGAVAAGRYARHWDGRDARGLSAPPGAYFVRLEAAGHSLTRKLVVRR